MHGGIITLRGVLRGAAAPIHAGPRLNGISGLLALPPSLRYEWYAPCTVAQLNCIASIVELYHKFSVVNGRLFVIKSHEEVNNPTPKETQDIIVPGLLFLSVFKEVSIWQHITCH